MARSCRSRRAGRDTPRLRFAAARRQPRVLALPGGAPVGGGKRIPRGCHRLESRGVEPRCGKEGRPVGLAGGRGRWVDLGWHGLKGEEIPARARLERHHAGFPEGRILGTHQPREKPGGNSLPKKFQATRSLGLCRYQKCTAGHPVARAFQREAVASLCSRNQGTRPRRGILAPCRRALRSSRACARSPLPDPRAHRGAFRAGPSRTGWCSDW